MIGPKWASVSNLTLNPVNIIVIDLDQSKVEVIHEREGTFPT